MLGPMNYGLVIFDSSDGKTINGIPTGFLSSSYPHIVGAEGKRPPIDLNRIVETFHSKEGDSIPCVYSELPADGISAVDGNPNNFLITNLEPVNRSFLNGLPPLPKGIVTKTYLDCGTLPHAFDLELKVLGLAHFSEKQLQELIIPTVPEGLMYTEAELMLIWNELTKKSLLKGLTQLTMIKKPSNTSISLSNRAVMEFLMVVLQHDVMKKEQENE